MALGASSVQAYNLPLPSGTFLLSDNSAENLIKGAGNTGTTLEVGDKLHGIFLIDDVAGQSILAGSGYDELTGVFETEVLTAGGGPGNYTWTFGPSAAFEATYGVGAMIAYFTDPVHEYVRQTNSGQTEAQMEALVTNGSLLWVASMVDGANFWRSNAATNDTALPGVPPNTAFGQYQWGLDITVNNSGKEIKQVSCFNIDTLSASMVDQCGNGQVISPAPSTGFTTPYAVWDDQNINMNLVPEPTTLALLGVTLLGFGATRRAKKSA